MRLNETMGEHEAHLVLGQGNISFEAVFAELKEKGYLGWFSLGFGDQRPVRAKSWFGSLL